LLFYALKIIKVGRCITKLQSFEKWRIFMIRNKIERVSFSR